MTQPTSHCFAADLGGTKLATAIADARGNILAELIEPTDPRGAAAVAEQIVACADKLVATLGGLPGAPGSPGSHSPTRPRHAMVGVPGAVDPHTGRISLTPHIAGLDAFDLLGHLRERFGPDVAIENDANLSMLGEYALGSARGCQHAAFLALGTGVGLGLLVDGKLFRGARGLAGEIADMPIGPVGSTFEREVGSPAIVDRFRGQGGTTATTVREIFAQLNHDDPIATEVIDTTAKIVAAAIVTMQSLLDLELIVLGGSIGVRHELIERVRRALRVPGSRTIVVEPSRLGDRAGLLGAAWAAGRGLREA